MTDALTLIVPPTGSLRVPQEPILEEVAPVEFSLIIPTYKESGNVKSIVQQLTRLLDGYIPGGYELILVDDDSPDQTWQIAQALTAEVPQLRVMRRQSERGLSSAVIRGWQVARGDILGVIDADLQHPPEVLLKLLAAVQGGADMAVASRHVEGGGVSEWSIMRRFLSRGAQVLGLIICPNVVGRVSDPMSGYFMVRRSAIAESTMNPKGYKILLEVIGRGDVGEIAEVGYVFQERVEGESKVTWKQYVDYIHHLAKLRSRGRVSRLRQRFPIDKFLRFGVVGFSGLIVDFFVFYLLREQVGLGLTTSLVISVEAAIINNFIWNDAWTFAEFSKQQQGWGARIKRLLKFNTICLAGAVLNVLLVNLLFNILGINEYVAKLIAIAAITAWNFWLNLKLSWRSTQAK
ncbi:MAG: glycosyltransferase [Cyanobacteria bacterium P01_D01_bin.128]